MAPRGVRDRRDVVVDTAMALALFGLFAATLRAFADLVEAPDLRWVGWQGYLAGALGTLPLAARRRAPLTTLVAVGAGLVSFRLLGGGGQPVFWIALFLAMFGAGVYGRPGARDRIRAAVLVTVLGASVWMVAYVEVPGRPPELQLVNLLNLVPDAVMYAAAWVLGDQWRLRRQREAELSERTAELEAERERSARQAVTEERLRIARELHDVIGHHVSVMGVQAAGARRVLPTDPAQATVALDAIEHSSRQVVTELQQVLALLRDDEGGRPRIARLGELAAEIRDAGVEVTVQVGELPALPASVDLAATRVVQEALTNVLRHAGPGASAWVRVRAADDGVEVVVEDDGRGRRRPDAGAGEGTGRGLVGLRERVAVHDGHFEAGPRPAGGFRVAARLPADACPPASTAATERRRRPTSGGSEGQSQG